MGFLMENHGKINGDNRPGKHLENGDLVRGFTHE